MSTIKYSIAEDTARDGCKSSVSCGRRHEDDSRCDSKVEVSLEECGGRAWDDGRCRAGNENSRGEGKYCKKYCNEILQKPPATWILTEEVSAGFAAVFGCSIFCGHLWSFCSQLREILREILHEKGQKTLEADVYNKLFFFFCR
jgi:hypothetical protein